MKQWHSPERPRPPPEQAWAPAGIETVKPVHGGSPPGGVGPLVCRPFPQGRRVNLCRPLIFSGPDKFCLFRGKRYSPGESWHPYLEPHGLMYCLRCTCSENTHVSCSQIHCPPIHCASPVTEPQRCCPRCADPPLPSGLRAPLKLCQYNGTTYQPGATFSEPEAFPSRQSNQCVQCSCTEGQIYCALMTCPEPGCSSPLPGPGSCCPACQDRTGEKSAEEEPMESPRGVRRPQDPCPREASGRRALGSTSPAPGLGPPPFKQKGGSTTVRIVLKEKPKKACAYNGRTYSHGEVWHPAFRSFGSLPCILCTCQDGSQTCQRVTCPLEYPCKDPERVEGKCCKICPEDRAKPNEEEINSTKCPKRPSRVPTHALTSATPEVRPQVLPEKERTEEVEVFVWKLVKGIFHLMQIKKGKKEEFQQEDQSSWTLPQTNEGHWNILRAQAPELRMTASPEEETKNL
ncbi:chordin-like protein 2 [Ornithorhynchus anatinus]|uniref:chordin-like protein 2 n=1 Tax=Ornithorhynchus anatinus TaxID=9258 RepID=UPI0019D443B3|nr:chordin-like protein 2 [Ornithorhynchus anatinus]